jgi:hypothetical protein
MPLLKPSAISTKQTLRINIDKYLVAKIESYCKWAGIKKTDEFIEQAAEFILAKDKDWQKACREFLPNTDDSSSNS